MKKDITLNQFIKSLNNYQEKYGEFTISSIGVITGGDSLIDHYSIRIKDEFKNELRLEIPAQEKKMVKKVKVTKENLDKRICDLYADEMYFGSNTMSYREAIRDYEKELNLDEKYLESLSDKELQDYLEKLEKLYIK